MNLNLNLSVNLRARLIEKIHKIKNTKQTISCLTKKENFIQLEQRILC